MTARPRDSSCVSTSAVQLSCPVQASAAFGATANQKITYYPLGGPGTYYVLNQKSSALLPIEWS